MNTNDAIALLWLVKAHWPHFEVFGPQQLPIQAGAWLDVIGDLDVPDVRAAIAELDTEGREFAPTPGQIRERVLAGKGATAPDWDQALNEVMQSIRQHGSRRGRQWAEPDSAPALHPAIEESVRAMGGWYVVGQAHLTEAWRAQFRDMYKLAAARFDREAKAPPVLAQLAAGLAEKLALGPGPETR